MSDILEGEAYQEFLQKRIEEITSEDETYRDLTQKSITAYNGLKKAFMEYINISTQLQAYSENLMLRSRLDTAQNTAQSKIKHNNDINTDSNMMQNAIRKQYNQKH